MCVHMGVIHRAWVAGESLRMASAHGCAQLRVSHEPQTRKEAEWEARAGRASGVNRDSSVWRQSGGRRPLHWASHWDAHIYWNSAEGHQKASARPGSPYLSRALRSAEVNWWIISIFSFLLLGKRTKTLQKMLSVLMLTNMQLLFNFKVFIKSNIF